MSCCLTWKLVLSSQKSKTAQTPAHEFIVSAFNLALFCYEASLLLIDSPTLCLYCLFNSILCMQRMRHRGRLRVELEWSSAPFTLLKYSSQYDTLFSLCPHSPICFSLLLHLTSHFCVTCGHFTSFQYGLAGL